jgi:hypothetical protein
LSVDPQSLQDFPWSLPSGLNRSSVPEGASLETKNALRENAAISQRDLADLTLFEPLGSCRDSQMDFGSLIRRF